MTFAIQDLLTDRELDVLACILNGRSVKKTASILKISPKTVETYLRNLMIKAQCTSREELIDKLTQAHKLSLLQKRYVLLLGHGDWSLKENSNLPPKQKFKTLFYLSGVLSFSVFVLFVSFFFFRRESFLKDTFPLPPSNQFLERPQLLRTIDQKFTNKDPLKTVFLLGTGGCGKTTLAHHYARLHTKGLAWEINASSKENIFLSYEKLAFALLHQEQDEKGIQTLQKARVTPHYETALILYLKSRLSQSPNWLLIFDNVNNWSEIQNYIPFEDKSWGNGKIIITSCNRSLWNLAPNQTLFIEELKEREKLSLFHKISKSHGAPATEGKQFLKSIPPYPLDISIAAHYLNAHSISYQEYLDRMKQNSKYFIDAQAHLLEDLGSYTKTRYSLVALFVGNLLSTHKDFGDLLLLISLLDSQDIPRSFLNSYKNQTVVDLFLLALHKQSLLKYSPSLSLHKTTQEIIRTYLTRMLGLNKQQKKIDIMIETLERYVDRLQDNQDLKSLYALMPHLLSFSAQKSLLSPLSKANLDVKIASIDIKAQLNHDRAQKFLEESLKIYRGFYPNAHPKVAWTLGQLGVLNKFNPQKQKLLFQESLKNYQDYYGQEDPLESAWVLVYFGNLYRRMGQYKKSQNFLEKSLKIYQTHYGYAHIQTAWVLANLGRFYRHVGDQKNAKITLEKTLKIHEHHPYQNEIEKAWVILNLGIVHHNLENFSLSQQLIAQGIKIYEKYYNHEDYELCWATIHQALTDANLTGDWKKAEKIIDQKVNIYIRKWGKEPAVKAWGLERLVRVYLKLKNHSKSQELLEEMLQISLKSFGPQSTQVGFCHNYLGELYFSLGNFPTALQSFKKAFKILQDWNHPRIYIILENLVLTYKELGQSSSFESLYYLSLFKKTTDQFLPSDSSLKKRLEKDYCQGSVKLDS